MDVDRGAAEPGQEVAREHLHVAGEDEHVDLAQGGERCVLGLGPLPGVATGMWW